VGATSIVSILTLLSGLYYPVEVLPQPFASVAYLIPLTHFLEYFRSFYGFATKSPHPLLWGFLLTALYGVIAFFFLNSAIKNGRQKGILTRMSE